jgi:ribosomal protein S18 acetylase RimI-like enzyme
MLRRGALRSVGLRSLSVAYDGLGFERWYVRVLLFARDLSKTPPGIEADRSLELRDLTEDEVVAFSRERPDPGDAEVRRRLAAGFRCVVARSGGRIVGETWLATGEVWLTKLGRRIVLRPDDIYVYYASVIPELRGRNIGSVRSRMLGEQLRAEGYRRMVYTVAPHNRPAFGPAMKLGAERLASIGYVRLGSLRLEFERWHRDAPAIRV